MGFSSYLMRNEGSPGAVVVQKKTPTDLNKPRGGLQGVLLFKKCLSPVLGGACTDRELFLPSLLPLIA